MHGLLTRRAILVTGKGGVGKTTLAAALARAASFGGRRVLVAELAPDETAPSALARVFGRERSSEEPVELAPNIRGALLTPAAGHHRFLRDTLPIRFLADAAMRSSAIRRFLGAAPAFAEMGVLYRMLDLLRRRRKDGTPDFETCVVDLPATGHALALAQLPEVLLKFIPGGPIGRAVREGLSLLTDPVHTAALVVTLPESLPVSESLELCAGLSKNHVPLVGIAVNRVPRDPFTADERAELAALNAARGPFAGTRSIAALDRAQAALGRLATETALPVYRIPEIPLRGLELVEALAEAVAFRGAGEPVAREAAS